MFTVALSTVVPAWVVVPTAAITMLVIAAHLTALQHSDVPPRRRRIRTSCGVLMMFLSALLAYAIGFAPSAPHPRLDVAGTRVFLVIWSLIIGLLLIVVVLATMDALYTAGTGVAARRRLRSQLKAELGAGLARHSQPSQPQPGHSDGLRRG